MECFLNQVKDVRLPQSLQRAMAAEAEAAREARAKVVMMLMVMLVVMIMTMMTVTVMTREGNGMQWYHNFGVDRMTKDRNIVVDNWYNNVG